MILGDSVKSLSRYDWPRKCHEFSKRELPLPTPRDSERICFNRARARVRKKETEIYIEITASWSLDETRGPFIDNGRWESRVFRLTRRFSGFP